MSKRFQVIVADCPWSFDDRLQQSDVKRGSAANYPTLTISDIAQLPVKDIADPNGAVLCLWVPSALLQSGLDIMKAYGFVHKQTYVWVKQKKQENIGKKVDRSMKSAIKNLVQRINKDGIRRAWRDIPLKIADHIKLSDTLSFGMGHFFRNCHEICLIGINNNKIYKQLENRSQRSVCFAENLKHSAKPEALQDALEMMFPKANRIEIFARRERKGWQCLGNEVGSLEDIRVSLSRLV